MSRLILFCTSWYLLLLVACQHAGTNKVIDQINAALDQEVRHSDVEKTDAALESLPVRHQKDQSIVAVIQDIRQAQQAADTHTEVTSHTESIFQQADSLADQIGHSGLSAWVSAQIGYYYYRLAQLEQALPYFSKSTRYMETAQYTGLIDPADCLVKNAYFFGTIGDHDKSIDYLSRALLFVDRTTRRYAAIEFALGGEYLKLQHDQQAEEHFVNSKNSAKNRYPIRYAKALGELALLAMNAGDLDKAEQYLLEDIQLSEKHCDARNTMFARIRLAKLYIEKGNWEAAKPLLHLAEAYVRPRANLIGFDHEITLLQLSLAEQSNDQNAQLALHRHLQSRGKVLERTDGEKVVLHVNLILQGERAEKDILLREAQLQQSKMKGIALLGICMLLVLIAIFLRRSKKQALQLQQAHLEQTLTKFQLEKIKSENKYTQAQQTIQSYRMFLEERNATIDELKAMVSRLKKSSSTESKNQRQKLEQLMEEHLMTEENWYRFKTTFIMGHAEFYTTVTEALPNITESQLRIALLQKLGLTNSGMATLLGVGQESIKKAKQRLRKKYGASYDQLFDDTDTLDRAPTTASIDSDAS